MASALRILGVLLFFAGIAYAWTHRDAGSLPEPGPLGVLSNGATLDYTFVPSRDGIERAVLQTPRWGRTAAEVAEIRELRVEADWYLMKDGKVETVGRGRIEAIGAGAWIRWDVVPQSFERGVEYHVAVKMTHVPAQLVGTEIRLAALGKPYRGFEHWVLGGTAALIGVVLLFVARGLGRRAKPA